MSGRAKAGAPGMGSVSSRDGHADRTARAEIAPTTLSTPSDGPRRRSGAQASAATTRIGENGGAGNRAAGFSAAIDIGPPRTPSLALPGWDFSSRAPFSTAAGRMAAGVTPWWWCRAKPGDHRGRGREARLLRHARGADRLPHRVQHPGTEPGGTTPRSKWELLDHKK